MITEVPGHVATAAYVQNHTQVIGGTNWDLSRTAVETPLSPLPDPAPRTITPVADCACYAPQGGIPSYAPNAIFQFGRNSVLLSTTVLQQLKRLPYKVDIVAGYASPDEQNPKQLAKKRAEVVTRQLKQYGKLVGAAKSFTVRVPATIEDFPNSQRVAVYFKN
jgi:hypothetical protein